MCKLKKKVTGCTCVLSSRS